MAKPSEGADNAPPLLFVSRPRQQLLGILAHNGTLPKIDILAACGYASTIDDEFSRFEAGGMVVRYGSVRERAVCFNEEFPAVDMLKSVLVGLEPRMAVTARRNLPVDAPVFAQPAVPALRTLFGPWPQTATILLLAVKNVLPMEVYRLAFGRLGAASNTKRQTISGLERRRLITVEDARIIWHPSFNPSALEIFARELLELFPILDLRPYTNEREKIVKKTQNTCPSTG